MVGVTLMHSQDTLGGTGLRRACVSEWVTGIPSMVTVPLGSFVGVETRFSSYFLTILSVRGWFGRVGVLGLYPEWSSSLLTLMSLSLLHFFKHFEQMLSL